MIQFPKSTLVGKIIPKEVFYKRLKLSSELKDRFVQGIQRITILNSLTTSTLRLKDDSKVEEIDILGVDLKKQEMDYRLLELIAKNNHHKLLFVIRYGDNNQLAIYHNKLYRTDWMANEEVLLDVKGFSLEEIWTGFVQQIALPEEQKTMKRLEQLGELLTKKETCEKLRKEIDKIEKQARKERQPRKKFELVEELNKLKNELNSLS